MEKENGFREEKEEEFFDDLLVPANRKPDGGNAEGVSDDRSVPTDGNANGGEEKGILDDLLPPTDGNANGGEEKGILDDLLPPTDGNANGGEEKGILDDLLPPTDGNANGGEEKGILDDLFPPTDGNADEEKGVLDDLLPPTDGEPGGGQTRLFDAPDGASGDVNGKTRVAGGLLPDGAKREGGGASDAGKPVKKDRKALRVAGNVGKYTGKTLLFILRKVVTYALSAVFTVLLVGTVVGVVVGMSFMIYLSKYTSEEMCAVPELENLRYDSSLTTELYYEDRSGNLVEMEDDRLSAGENRLWVSIDDIPEKLVDAYVCIEDQRFRKHAGVDQTRTLSAVYNFFVPSGSSYGGSTITQQLIKNVTGDNDNTMQRKIQEIYRARYVEDHYTKDQILEMYLNTISLSEGCYGVRAAAEEYFGKELSDLTLNECAAIASIGKSPVQYDPLINPQQNLERRNLVLREMLRQGAITQEEFDEAYDSPLQLAEDSENYIYTEKVHSYYVDAVIDDVISDLMEKLDMDKRSASLMLYSGGLRIETCVDPQIQKILETVYTDESYWPATTGIQAQSAMCVMDPKTGNLLGIVGGRGEKKISRGLNRATQSKRQCGSSVKPIAVYAYALDTGLYNYVGPCDDVPALYSESTGFWPNNATRNYTGRSSLENAIQRSLNTVAVKTCQALGVRNVYDNMVRSGFTTLVENYTTANGTTLSDVDLSPLSLGSFTLGVTVREMTQAYACFANGGLTSHARTYSIVRDAQGEVLLDNRQEPEQLYSESTAFLMTKLLEKVITGPHGTARSYIDFHKQFGLEVAAKTGTTNDNKDLYFCGYTPDLVGACWYGYDNNKTITARGGAAAGLWNHAFRMIYEYYEAEGIPYAKAFTQPNSVAYAKGTGMRVCTISGKLATDACENDIGHYLGGASVVTDDFYYLKADPPVETCDKHIAVQWDRDTQAICMPGCGCPESSLVTVGFRRLEKSERCFARNVRISDASYIYIDVPSDYVYPEVRDVPFYYNLYGEGESPGSSGGAVYNRVCSEHLHGNSTGEDGSTGEDTSTDGDASTDEGGSADEGTP